MFTTEVLAGMVADGSSRLTAPLQQHASAGTNVPRFGDREITLLDLATHSGGLPREIGDVPPNSIPFTWPTMQQRWSFLAGCKLPWAPGSVAPYSNIGFDLLVEALSVAAGKNYPALLYDRITGPLGMADTGIDPTKDQWNRLITGCGIGGLGACVNTSATTGSGGMYSTASARGAAPG
jgi:serine-type D-Ala-D-Ala carboxypeptidase/endopeptidase